MRLGLSSGVLRGAFAGIGKTPRRLLALLAGNSLLFRGGRDALREALEALSESVALPAVQALLSLQRSQLYFAGELFGWSMLAYFVYQFLPRLFPDREPATTLLHQRRFRLILTGVVCAGAIPTADRVPSIASRSVLAETVLSAAAGETTLGGLIFGWVLASAFVIGCYLYIGWWRRAAPKARLDLTAQLTGGDPPDQELDDLRHENWVGTASSGTLLVACTLNLVLACGLFGLVTGFAGMAFPIPEVVVLAGVTGAVVKPRLPSPVGDRLPDRDAVVDVESRWYTVVRYSTTSFKGRTTGTVFVFGMAVSLMLTLLSFVGIALFGYLLVRRPGVFLGDEIALITRWNVLGILVCATVPGLYSLWFWSREAVRLPHFLRYWNTSRSRDAKASDDDLPPLVARPPGALLAPSGLVALMPLVPQLEAGRVSLVPDVALAVGWPVALAAAGWSVWRAFRGEPQHPRTDRHVVPLAFVVLLAWGALLFGVLDVQFFTAGEAVVVGAIAVAGYYLPDAQRSLDAAGIESPNAMLLLVGIAGGGALVLRAAVVSGDSPLATLLLALGATLVGVAGLGFALTRLASRSR